MFNLKFKHKRPVPPQPRRTARGEQRRLALLKIAQEVFLERGYEGASIEEIMRRVGGSKASLYSYFGSKEGLFLEIMLAQSEAFMSELKVPQVADRDLGKTLRRIATSFLKALLDQRRGSLFRIMISEGSPLPIEMSQRFHDSGMLRGREAFCRYLLMQHEAGRLRIADAQRAAAMFFDLVKGQPHTRLLLGLSPFASGDSMKQHIESAVNLFLHGAAPHSESAR